MAADTAQATRGFLNSADGTRLAYREWPLPGAPVTFAVVHGLGEYSGRYQRFADGMSRHGLATFAVDLRGHGDSEGQRGHVDSWAQWIEDTVAFVSHVQAQTPVGEVVPLGHSFGGAAMLSTIRSGRLTNTKRFVLSSPALKLKIQVPPLLAGVAAVASTVAPRFSLDNNVDAATVSRIPEIVDAYRTDPLVHHKISARLFAEWRRAARENLEHAGDIKVPFLITAGTADGLIDSEGSRELHRRAPETSELHMLEGRYHEPFNDLGSEEVFDLIARWVRA